MDVSAESIWLATAAVDMRTGIDGLSLFVQQAFGRPLSEGTAYMFAN
ncbi:MAG: IS66 family insertion sequence element accessory protein TnpB [Pseudomonadota bacterium]|nr:IS66 family insertion sequence element accessory protein TnpB [Pseudomonadota bacterium]